MARRQLLDAPFLVFFLPPTDVSSICCLYTQVIAWAGATGLRKGFDPLLRLIAPFLLCTFWVAE
jgi:hypothetical protein